MQRGRKKNKTGSRKEISPNLKNMENLGSTVLASRANQIKEELRQKLRKPYKQVIDLSWGDPHAAGVKPLSFVRQVLAACLYPDLVNSNTLPVDVRQRAQRLLGECAGGSVGSYTATAGIPEIVHRISEFITKRDGGAPSDPENIYISPGSQWALRNILKVLVNSQASPGTGVLTPGPCYPLTNFTIKELGGVTVPYCLSEEQGWELQVEELHRALDSAKGVCNPVALYVINPGNPAGYVQSRKTMQEVIRFASEKRLFLLADEVYQECVHGENSEFLSYKRVLSEMGPPLSDTVELASFHSASKGFMGECGLRGGYVELVNLDPDVMKCIYKLFSTDTCAPVLSQIALDLMTSPPQPGDPSYPLYIEETQHIKTMMVHNVKRVFEVLNSLPGFSCQPVEGGAFAFPRLYLPPKAIQKAKEMEMEPDLFYCMRLLEEAGVLVKPGMENRPKEGTHHIRFCILNPEDTMEEILSRLSSFHTQFMKDFS
ncbi:alanine aminotransferase 2-like [Notothenia coriiceps]|uniref:alanine transaminase n=1 Tax=Notothenia coriiceps TaxID=8208 RepID=A0A6I9MRW7_9TELE|nr:PREDICTED: alanine aminotransferase 2-like [Notothenia coriiceps]